MNWHRITAGFRHFSGTLTVVLMTVLTGTMSVSEGVAAPDEALSLFGSDVQRPFLTPTLNGAVRRADDENVDPLETRFLSMQAELDQLKKTLDSGRKNSEARIKAGDKPDSPKPVVYPTVKMTGFFQADAGWFQQDTNSRAQLGDIPDNRGFRRTRLGANGKVAENVSYALEMDFALLGRPSFRDVRMDFSDVPIVGNVRIGAFRQPFGMDEFTSAREMTFLERSSLQGMAPFRQFGVSVFDTTDDQNVTWAASAFGTNTDQFGNSVGDRGYGVASRVTAVITDDNAADFTLHCGMGYAFLTTPNNQFQYRGNPEYLGPVVSTAPIFTDTGLFPADNANLFNGELASTWGSWHAQSELRYNAVNLNNSGSAGFPSFYAQTGYILTGEHRPYNKTTAVLGRIKPKNAVGKCGGIGAWELACRYSWLDLNQGAVTGGEISNMTYGLNWYLNDFTKLQFNYISSNLNRAPIGDSHTDIFALRAQLDF